MQIRKTVGLFTLLIYAGIMESVDRVCVSIIALGRLARETLVVEWYALGSPPTEKIYTGHSNILM